MSGNYELNIEKRAKWLECYISINEVIHRIYYKTTLDGMFHLYVDDKCVLSKKTWLVKLNGLDYEVEIDGKILHCVFAEKKLDVAVCGKYIKSQKYYIPKKVLSRAVIMMIIMDLVTVTFQFMVVEEVIELTQKQTVGTIIFLNILVLGTLGHYENLYKRAEKRYKKLEEG